MGHHNTPTTADFLGEQLKDHLDLRVYSSCKIKSLRLFDMVLGVILSRKSKVILIDTYSTKAFWFAIICARLAEVIGTHYIPILHGGNLKSRAEKTPKLFSHYLKNAYVVISPSAFLIDGLSKYFKFKSVIISNSIQIDKYHFKKREHRGSVNLLWVRAFQELYNPILAVEILSKLTRLGYDAKLCMVGPDKDGTLAKVEAAILANAVEDRVEITGLLSKNEWIKKSADFNFFLNTTNIDNSPVSVMEAMALGLIVLSTKVGGIPYMIDDWVDGIMFNQGDVDDCVEKVIKITNSPELMSAVSTNAREKAEQWDIRKTRKRYLKIIENV